MIWVSDLRILSLGLLCLWFGFAMLSFGFLSLGFFWIFEFGFGFAMLCCASVLMWEVREEKKKRGGTDGMK